MQTLLLVQTGKLIAMNEGECARQWERLHQVSIDPPIVGCMRGRRGFGKADLHLVRAWVGEPKLDRLPGSASCCVAFTNELES